MEYRSGSHSKYDLKIHLVWITKYRKPILKGEIADRIRHIVREICNANEVIIIKGHVSSDHIHLLLSYPPRLSISKLVQYLKEKTSRKLLQEYGLLRKQFWGQHIWARGYFVVSVGTMTDEIVKDYIENQGKLDNDGEEDFRIEDK